MKKVYRRWYKYIKDNANDKTIRVKVEIEIEIRNWGM